MTFDKKNDTIILCNKKRIVKMRWYLQNVLPQRSFLVNLEEIK